MPVTWNDAARAKLLMAIVKTSGGKIDYKGIVEFMGPEYNAKCIQNQIQFIKNKANGDKAPGSTPSTPTKSEKKGNSAAGSVKTPTKSPASAKRGHEQAVGPESETTINTPSPANNRRTKKLKTECKKEIKKEIKSEENPL
ncbi:hypothetical protein MaudCBS49596_001794 [Microsporum audouinii]